MNKKTLVLIDGHAVMYRAYHGLAKSFNPLWNGKPVGMVYGFTSMLLSIIEHFQPDNLIVSFDSGKTFRHDADENYKAQRAKTPDDFHAQVPLVEEMLEAFDIQTLTAEGFESDDIIGTIALQAESQGFEVKIVSGDLDFTQLVSEQIKLVKLNGKIEASVEYGPEETMARYGITPLQMIDFKAITGDSSDNYKGVEGIGPKTATDLLVQFQSIQGIYENIKALKPNIREKFESHKEYLFHCQFLAAIRTDVPLEYNLTEKFHFEPILSDAFLDKMKFRNLQNRYQQLMNKSEKEVNTEQKNSSKKEKEESIQMSMF
jgi:DNA polymerase-1